MTRPTSNNQIVSCKNSLIANTHRIADVRAKSGNATVAQRLVETLRLGLANPSLQSNCSIAECLCLLLQLDEDAPRDALAASGWGHIHPLDFGCVVIKPSKRTAANWLTAQTRH